MNFILKIAITILIVNSKCIRSLLISDICGEGLKCVHKCCPNGHYVFEDTCLRNDTIGSADFSEVSVYNADLESTGKKLHDVFSVVKGGIHEEGTDGEWTNSYLMENGKLLVKITMPNTPTKSPVFENDEFCVDYVMTEDSKYPKIAFRVTMPPEKDNSVKIKLNIAAFIISSFFLALVLIVYSMFASLRNLVGKIIMSLAASLLGGFVMYATLLLYAMKSEDALDVGFCRGSFCCIYFFLLASLFWMNVFSYDIWKQFRKKRLCSYREKRWEDRRKYLVYSIYAWGTPLAMAIMLLLLDLDIIDVTSMPRFIKPNIVENNNNCFLEETETIYYLYMPMLILLLCNWVFYLMTVYAIWRTKRDARTMGVTSTPNNIKQRMMIFLRLSLVMGVNWLLEVLTAIAPDLPIWYITDMYNLLIGVAIFIIAVCNRKVYKLIVKRLSSRSRSQPSFMKTLKSSSQTQDSTLSDEPSNEVQLLSLNKQSNKEQAY